jgi:hypothetical protein
MPHAIVCMKVRSVYAASTAPGCSTYLARVVFQSPNSGNDIQFIQLGRLVYLSERRLAEHLVAACLKRLYAVTAGLTDPAVIQNLQATGSASQEKRKKLR